MSRKQTTTYECDACGKTVENAKALRSVMIEIGRHGRSEALERFDVCETCQGKLADWLGDFTQSRIDAEAFRRDV